MHFFLAYASNPIFMLLFGKCSDFGIGWIFMFSNKIAENLMEQDILQASDQIKFRFGLESINPQSPHFLTCLCIGIFLHCFFDTLLFLFIFPIFHQYLHGLHAENKARCYIASVCIYCIGIWLYYFLNIQILQFSAFVVFLLVSFIIIRDNMYSSSLMSLPLSRTPYAFFVVCVLIGI